MQNSIWSNIVGTIGWGFTFAVFGGVLYLILWGFGIVIGYLLRGTPQ